MSNVEVSALQKLKHKIKQIMFLPIDRLLGRLSRRIVAQNAEFYRANFIEMEQKIAQLSSRLLDHEREFRSLSRHYAAHALPAKETWEAGVRSQPATTPSRHVFDHSTVCRQEHFDSPDFAFWIKRLGASRTYHRKNWEHVYICQALFERDVIKKGSRGLGFAVGQERLPALFASMDCEVLATDLADNDERSLGWKKSGEHAARKAHLAFPDLISADRFDQLVSFQSVDMTAIPEDLKNFDFCWSACAFEHLGSIEAGMRFVEASVACLKPGGYAVHTTEFNLSSDSETVDNEDTVLFRRRDMISLAERLSARGYRVAPLDFDPGSLPLDQYVDLPPYTHNPHLRLLLLGYVATSFGIIIQR